MMAFDRQQSDEMAPWLDDEPANEPLVEGRVPPHDLDAEAAVLSAVMNDKLAFDRVAEFLRPDHFYSEAHRRIFEACIDLSSRGTTPDVVSVGSWLRDRDRLSQVGGMAYLTTVLNSAPGLANVVAYATTVHETWRVRQLILTCQRVTAQGYAGYGDADAFLAGASSAVQALEAARAPAAPAPPPWESRVLAVPSDWYSTRPQPREWLLHDRRTSAGALARGIVGVLVAQGGAGKSMLLAQLAVAVATGTPWLGVYEPTAPGRVLLLLCEETLEEVQRRLWRATGAAHVAPPAGGMIDAMGLHGVECALLARGDRGEMVETAFAAWLRERVARERYALVALDPHSRLGGPEAETSNAAATRAVQEYESIAASGASVVVAHHTPEWERRGAPKAGQASAGRGVSAFVDGARWQLHAAVEEHEGVDEHLREIVTIAGGKSNYERRSAAISLRRDQEWGGAMVPLDDTDRALVDAARGIEPARVERQRVREAERNGHESAEDRAVLQAVRETPGIPLRDLVKRVQAIAHCGANRAEVAIARVADKLDVREGPRKARLHHLRGTDA